MRQQRIRTDVEGHAQKCVGRSLIKLTVKNSRSLNLELKQSVTWRQIDVVAFAGIPTADY
jgi:hypothetical protein